VQTHEPVVTQIDYFFVTFLGLAVGRFLAVVAGFVEGAAAGVLACAFALAASRVAALCLVAVSPADRFTPVVYSLRIAALNGAASVASYVRFFFAPFCIRPSLSSAANRNSGQLVDLHLKSGNRS